MVVAVVRDSETDRNHVEELPAGHGDSRSLEIRAGMEEQFICPRPECRTLEERRVDARAGETAGYGARFAAARATDVLTIVVQAIDECARTVRGNCPGSLLVIPAG